jgi:hypothetical protein
MLSKIVVLAGILLYLSASAISQTMPVLTRVDVSATVSYDTSDSYYYYTYSISNNASSFGSLQRFKLDISSRPGTIRYDTTGLKFNNNSYLQSNFRGHYDELVGKIVPCGFASLPQGWSGLWGSIPSLSLSLDQNFVSPGANVTGIVIMSRGLPCIRSFLAMPHFDVDALFPSIDDTLSQLTVEDIDSIRHAVNFEGLTIGPTAPDSSFQPLDFLDNLDSTIQACHAVNWIPAEQTLDKYLELFQSISGNIIQCEIELARSRIDTVLNEVNVDSSGNLSHEAYALIRFNTSYLKGMIEPSDQVQSGITISDNGGLTIRVKPLNTYDSGDTLRQMQITVRWPAAFNVTLGEPSGSYGFTKNDSAVTLGPFRYQKFRSSTSLALNWVAGNEYQLFTVPISGLCGAETFELTNALPGGEWFVDINYLDKTDSVFYQPVAQGFAFQNKSSGNGATAYSGERHAAIHGSTFHEVFESGSEIIYRRKNLNSASWDTTTRISGGNGSNNDASIVVAHDGSVHVVWQRQLNANAFALWYNKSTDGGLTWGTPVRPTSADSVVIIQQNQWNIYPLISELGTSQLVIVVCTSSGPKYMVSSNLGSSWTTLASIPNVSNASYVWHPSMAPGSNFLLLSYDTRYWGVFSKKYDGTNWLSEQSAVSGVGTIYDRMSSIAVDGNDIPYIVWAAQRSGQSEYRIIYKYGNYGGTGWSSYYTEFSHQTGISDYYPSVSPQIRGGVLWRADVLYGNTANQVWLNQQTYSSWGGPSMVSSTGQWPVTTLQERGSSLYNDVRLWTDQSGSSPYEIKRASDGGYQLQSIQGPMQETELHRRVTLESVKNGSDVSFEVGPLKILSTSGDTTILPFKKIDRSKPLIATVENVWDYLGTDSVAIPANARSLIVDADIQTTVREDTLGTKGMNVFPTRSFRIEAEGSKGSSTLLSDARGSSGTKVINVSSFSGQKVIIRPVGIATPSTGETPVVGIGDVYVLRR